MKITDPTSVVLIVNRDSNDIAFMDIATHKMVGNVFLGNNVNPHMAMMSHDGRYVVTGGTRANKAYIIDVPTMTLLKEIRVDFAPEHLAFSPDGRYYYQGNPDGDSISVIDMVSMTEIKRIPGLVEPLNITFTPDGTKAYIGNYGAHWVGVIDVTRHELLKRIQIGEVPGVAKLDPDRYLGEIKGVSNASISNDGRYLYAADSDLGIVGVIDTRDDKVVKTIRVGAEPLARVHEPRRPLRGHGEQRRRNDFRHRYGAERSRRHSRSRSGHDRRQFRRRQSLRHQRDERFRVRVRHGDIWSPPVGSRSA